MSIAPELGLLAQRRGREQKVASLPAIAATADAALVVAVLTFSALGRTLLWPPEASGAPSAAIAWFAPALAVAWLLCLFAAGAYRAAHFGAGTDEYKAVVLASVGAAAVGSVVAYLGDLPLSRSFYVTAFAVGTPALLVGRFVLRRALHRARCHGRLVQQTLIVGSPEHVDALAGVISREKWLGYRVLGALTPTAGEQETEGGVPVLGTSAAAAEIAQRVEADVLFVADGAFGSPNHLRQVAWDLEHHDIQVVIAPGVTDVSRERIRVRPVGGLPLMHLERPRASNASMWLKRCFDLVVAGLLVIALAPLMSFLALRILAFDGGPVMFRQTRVGRDGRSFTCLKFRSMVLDAEKRLADLKAQEGFSGGLFKMREDPRVTSPGRWMRRLSLDELPQLFNVLRGDMSLIGPRPPLPSEVAEYDEFMSRRLRVLPGLTGLWQVSGRSNLTFEEAIRLDLYYVDNWSMLQDLAILFRTAKAVFGSHGAF